MSESEDLSASGSEDSSDEGSFSEDFSMSSGDEGQGFPSQGFPSQGPQGFPSQGLPKPKQSKAQAHKAAIRSTMTPIPTLLHGPSHEITSLSIGGPPINSQTMSQQPYIQQPQGYQATSQILSVSPVPYTPLQQEPGEGEAAYQRRIGLYQALLNNRINPNSADVLSRMRNNVDIDAVGYDKAATQILHQYLPTS